MKYRGIYYLLAMKEIKKGRITMMFRKGSFKKGFTLSEVLITIAI
ncbi:MAG: prepilin-type N-terminal cleavage/methylation domain-containing protein, partial [Cyanobacteria bacterium SIG30]|nr:prepilin-type N-terminal cleavage/methylation domain-containing protein [Cyanobacteria bacterium SIG30]